MNNSLLAGLTEPQLQAVTHVDGPLLVLAGPGSGKTRVITRRLAHLVSIGIEPYNILAITFTNKAAMEMKERVASLKVKCGSTVCTFHSFAARLLREYASNAGLSPNFSIYDDGDQLSAMRDGLKAANLDPQNFPPARLLKRISNYKNDLKTPDDAAATHSNYMAKILAKAYRAYQQQLADNNALDFDDLLMKLALLLRDDKELRDRLNDRYKYVLVDEYQDTNHCQYQITRGLTLNHCNLCVSGDPDQSIYGWRGADIGNILAFEEDYPGASVIRLEENFRSTPEVLAVADDLIRKNISRKDKGLFTAKPSGEPIELTEYRDEHDEAKGLAYWLKQMRQAGYEYRQMAVFYRVNSMSRVLEEWFRREHIPYQIVRGVEFFKRREIKDMVAYLRLLVNPSDQVAIKRIINRPTRGIGNTTVGRLFAHCDMTGMNIWDVLKNIDSVATLGTAAKSKIRNFVQLIEPLREKIEGSVESLMQIVYDRTGLKAALASEKHDDPLQNVDELISSAAEYDSKTELPSLVDYLQEIALTSDADAYDENAGCVSLMTLHAAKGLEFPVAMIIGLEDGMLPHKNSFDSDKGIEEERRLLFVGITRAQERLFLSYARNRTTHGMSLAAIRSPFLRDLTGLETHNAPNRLDTQDFDDDSDDSNDTEEFNYADEDQSQEYFRGQLVRHPKLGLGRIQEVMPSCDNSRVIVQFNNGARKTLVLKYAKLEVMD